MKHNSIETAMGAVVLAVAGIFLGVALRTAQVDTSSGYTISAAFANANGLNVGADVRLGGVTVGAVSGLSLDPVTYQAVVTLTVHDGLSLPVDTSATIRSESLMGGKYLALEPGGDDKMLAAGGRIVHTQSTPDIEQMLGQAIFSMSQGQNQNRSDPASSGSGGGSAGQP